MATVKFRRICGSKSCKCISKNGCDVDCKSNNDTSKMQSDNFMNSFNGSESYVEETSSSDSEMNLDDDDINISPLGSLGVTVPHTRENFDLRGPIDLPLKIPTAWDISNEIPRTKKKFKKKASQEGISHNFVDFINQRSIGMLKNPQTSIENGFGTRQIASQFLTKEILFELPPVNKIFSSKWLTDDQILMGTKSNDLLLYNIHCKKTDIIPALTTDNSFLYDSKRGGIYSIDINPSKSLLCTNAQNNADIAVYKLPTLDPLYLGEGAHSDLAFDMSWLDDQIFMSVSRDNSLAVWKADDDSTVNEDPTNFTVTKPLAKRSCRSSDRLRALVFNKKQEEAAVLSFNSNLHIFDTHTLKQTISQRLEQRNENVCLAINEFCSLYAVGSKTHATLIDPRTLQTVYKFDISTLASSIRSISFQEDIITLGTGVGKILLFDLKAHAILANICSKNILQCSKSLVSSTDSIPHYDQQDSGSLIPPAIYTHCYDWSGTKLFAAGGPLSSAHTGHYAALWC